ncbi:hypothetical protein GCM10028799_76870 [Kribbella italica]
MEAMTKPEGLDLDQLFRDHGPAIVAYALRRTSDLEESRDVCQEVFLVAVRRGEVPAGRELPWLYQVARNVLDARRRRDGRSHRAYARVGDELVSGEPVAPVDPLGDQVAAADELAGLLRVLRDDLRLADQEVLMLTAWEGLSRADLANVLGCSPATAVVKLVRARRRLRTAWQRRLELDRSAAGTTGTTRQALTMGERR